MPKVAQPTTTRKASSFSEKVGSAKPKKTRKRSTTTKAEDQPQKERSILYSELKGSVGWLSAEDAKKFLKWNTPKDDKPFQEYLFKDKNDITVKCGTIEMQRPFYMPLALQYMSEILGGHWNGDGGETNGEAIVIGRTGLVIEGKHRLIALPLAVQEWLKNPNKYPFWKEEPKIHCFIHFGVREDVKSINTLNTGKPRTLGDAIYASGLFGQMNGSRSKEKRTVARLSKMLDYSVRLLWHRTGARKDAFAPKRTHAESLDFIQRHPRLIEAVKHIDEENGNDGNLKFYPSPGYAAALLYLMGSADTVRENDELSGYMQVDCPTEDLLDWSLWDKARDFWTLIAGKAKETAHLREKISNYLDSEGGAHREERIASIVKAWWCYQKGMAITAKALDLETVVNADGIEVLAECPTVGDMLGSLKGIDLGEPPKD